MKKNLILFLLSFIFFGLLAGKADAARTLKITSSYMCYNEQHRVTNASCPVGIKGFSGNYRIRARIENYGSSLVDYGQLYYADGNGNKYRPYVHMAIFYSFYNLMPHKYVDINSTNTIVFCDSLNVYLWDGLGGFGAKGENIPKCN